MINKKNYQKKKNNQRLKGNTEGAILEDVEG